MSCSPATSSRGSRYSIGISRKRSKTRSDGRIAISRNISAITPTWWAVGPPRNARHKPAMVGTAFSMASVHAASDSDEDRLAAQRWHQFSNVWFLETVMNGRYPQAYVQGAMDDRVEIKPNDMNII